MFGLSKKIVITGVVGLAVIIIIITACVVFLTNFEETKKERNSKFISPSSLGKYQKAAVSTNGVECAEIGNNMLLKNGSAVDAAIAALLCEGVASLQSMGLGGGFLMTIWDAKTGKAEFLNARETAPAKATRDMYDGNATSSMYGGKAVAVPGELLGYWEAHRKYGRLDWADLFTPTIELCERGALVTSYLAQVLLGKISYIKAEPTLAEILINPRTNSTWKVGDRIKRPRLAETLKVIAKYNVSVFYNGSMGEEIVKEIQGFGGIIEMNDLRNYRVEWKEPITSKLGNLTIHSAALPGSGVVLTFILNVLEKFLPMGISEEIFWQRIVETFKWAYAHRTELGDDRFVELDELISNLTSKSYAEEIREKIKDNWTSNDPKFYGVVTDTPMDYGTAQVSVLAPDGSAVSVTSTINQIFGAMIRSKSTGIIFNDEMDDFSSPNITNGFDLPPSPANFIVPGKRPLSSMTPTIIVDETGEVQLVLGAAGGTKITTGIASTLILNLWRGYNIKEAVDARRLHHQLLPMRLEAEPNFSVEILEYLMSLKHNVSYYGGLGSAVTAISKINHPGVTANSDYRRVGSIAGF
ncbi:scoloptoxin SSD14-like [Microplitis mediator]|uniref:scoloptoxin SSD14-like n=1 Tax=Microplitis mediator TaxID=375433 RepID=UPI0025566BF2|nr:scoloptoxin SSD14-like [Microplitis mediator]